MTVLKENSSCIQVESLSRSFKARRSRSDIYNAVMKWRNTCNHGILFPKHLKDHWYVRGEAQATNWPLWDICLCPLLSSCCAAEAAPLQFVATSVFGSSVASEPPEDAHTGPALWARLLLRAGGSRCLSPAARAGSRCSSFPSNDLGS